MKVELSIYLLGYIDGLSLCNNISALSSFFDFLGAFHSPIYTRFLLV